MFLSPAARARSRVPTPAIINRSLARALDYGVAGNGSTNDGLAVQAFLTRCKRLGEEPYFPGNRTYDLGNKSIAVPDGMTVRCARDATFRRSAYPVAGAGSGGALIKPGNRVTWQGGIFTNNVTFGTSATSNTVGAGSKTWAVPTGLDINVNDFVRAYRTSAQANYMEGLVTAYAAGSITINVSFTNGSGTFTDWTFASGNFHNTALIGSAVEKVKIEDVEVTGNWYIGFVLDGGSPVAASTTRYCTIRDCIVDGGAMNRGFYMYEDVARCNFINCVANATPSTPMDYGFNFNAANPAIANNSIRDSSIVGCQTNGTYFQGFGVGDQCNELSFDSCVAANVINANGNGFSSFFANITIPTFISFTNCHAKFCANIGFFVAGAAWNTFTNCFARSNTTAGFRFDVSTSNADHNMLVGCQATLNGVGIHMTAGSTNNILTGCRSFNNTTNVTNASASTVISAVGGAVTTT